MPGTKVKAKLEHCPDADLTLAVWENEISDADRTLADHRLALSVPLAIASDQHVLATLMEEEALAGSDHTLAVSLSEDMTRPYPEDSELNVEKTLGIRNRPLVSHTRNSSTKDPLL